MHPEVSVILIHFGPPESTYSLLRLFERTDFLYRPEIIVVDNGDTPCLDPGRGFANVVLASQNGNKGYAAACNLGAGAAKGRYYLFLNNDISFDHDFIEPLVAACRSDSRVGAVGPRLSWPDGCYQPSWSRFPGLYSEMIERRIQKQARVRKGAAWQYRARLSERAREVDLLTGAAILITREAFESVGGFDSAYSFYFEDVDICRRLNDRGFIVRFEPASHLIHQGGGSQNGANNAKALSYRRGQLRFYARHKSAISFHLIKLYLHLKYSLDAVTGKKRNHEARMLIREVRSARLDELRRNS